MTIACKIEGSGEESGIGACRERERERASARV